MAVKKKEHSDRKSDSKIGKVKTRSQNKILRKVFIFFGLVLGMILLIYVVIYNMNHFTYEGVKFEVVKFCDAKPCLILYKTSLPVIFNGQKADYNIYLRKDPREIGEIPFEGELNFLPNMVLNSERDFNCDGDGIIAGKNLNILYSDIIEVKVIKNESLKCNPEGGYMFLNIEEGNQTQIEQTDLTCYNIKIKGCEILEGTERFMLETFIKLNKILSNESS